MQNIFCAIINICTMDGTLMTLISFIIFLASFVCIGILSALKTDIQPQIIY